MTSRSPLITLGAVGLAFGVLAIVNATAGPAARQAAELPPSTPTPVIVASVGPPPAPTATPSPARTSSPSPPRRAKRKASLPARAVYVGRSQDGSLAVAVAVLGQEAAGYLCDGRRVEAWLQGTARDGRVVLRGTGKTGLKVRLEGKELRGEVTVRGQRTALNLQAAKHPAGLYRAQGSRTTVGWIVLPDGSQVGLQTSKVLGSRPAPGLSVQSVQEVVVNGERLAPTPMDGRTGR